ncbi:hypothetical protein DICSQDRAFT_52722 [Dichomitus squalens LYAD-421 SS1]|uniref:uncharacterized protein n=1 Tax=Dichomitus squalens (strain LYAD-421) TaxID=732165 RepID=UPI00044134AD|nr:uncharacterized protein DICSQDRAFT_52722 [Dichomitus squalens LYAD-421 SS1]EJF64754.1 hypothetical protein DICSQDRAFT_52722 [Dichomitus squalens LYAD-421 SS1]
MTDNINELPKELNPAQLQSRFIALAQVGINYFGQSAELKGCINDARNVTRYLQQLYGYREEDIVLLTDDAQNPRQIPTRDNIMSLLVVSMQWLVRNVQPNDSRFFHYSGHGGQTKDLDGDEADGYDEVSYPVDFQQAGHLVDDTMHETMVRPFPAGCRSTAIFDVCSESCLVLSYASDIYLHVVLSLGLGSR